MSENYPPPSPMADYFTSIGRIATAWAYFELHVNLSIWELANVSQQAGACITSHIGNPNARFRALIALVQLRGGTDSHYKVLNNLSGKADALSRQRNRLVHDPGSQKENEKGEKEGFFRFEVTADRTLTFGMQQVNFEDISKLENQIKTLTRQYKNSITSILAELPTFSRREFRREPRIDLSLPEVPSNGS